MTKISMLIVGMFPLCFSVMRSASYGKHEEQLSLGPDFPSNHLDFDTILEKIDRCCDGIANLKLLEGDWRLFMVSKEPPPGTDLDIKLRLKHEIPEFDMQRLYGSLIFPNGDEERVNMTQIGHYNLLINTFDTGNPDKPKIVPVLLIGYEQSRYVSFWQAGNGTAGTADWAIFVRPWVNNLEDWEVARATDGLVCLQLVDEDELAVLIN